MKIQVDNYIINSDKYNFWVTECVTNKKGEIQEKRISGYHKTALKAVQDMTCKNIMQSTATTLDKLSECIDKELSESLQLLADYFEACSHKE